MKSKNRTTPKYFGVVFYSKRGEPTKVALQTTKEPAETIKVFLQTTKAPAEPTKAGPQTTKAHTQTTKPATQTTNPLTKRPIPTRPRQYRPWSGDPATTIPDGVYTIDFTAETNSGRNR